MAARDEPNPRRALGLLGERLALEHFQRLGFELLARNYRTRWGEIDLIVYDGQSIVFAEVKSGRARAGVAPFERMDIRKQLRIRHVAAAWLREPGPRPRPVNLRFDAVAVTVDAAGRLLALEHVEGAF